MRSVNISSDFRMSGVLLTLALMLLATANVGHCHCPGIHNFGFCAFRIRCVGDIEGVSLPEECQGSVNHPVTVDLTLTDAQPFDDNVDTEFLNTITTFRSTASWPQTSLSFLTHMTKLKNLILTSNQIETIDGEPFYNLKYLQYLDLSRNALNDIEDLFSFESQNSLKKLLLSYNDIEEIPGDVFSELLNLKELDLSYNKISDLSEEPFCNLTNLEILRLNHNMIRTLNGSVNSLTNLKHLHLRDNQIQVIDVPSLAIIYHLETFDISGNQLDELKPIIFLRHWQHLNHSQLFSGVCKISFAENRITSIPNGTSKELSFIGEATTTSKIDVQTELDLSKNEINIIEFNAFQSITKLIKLDLSCNKLSDFIVYAYDMKDLKYLNLSSNHISNLYFDSFSLMKNLQSLDLSHNKVEYIEDETFTNSHNLKHVNMTFNGITALKNLRIKMFHPDGGVLDLSNNGLSRLGFGLGEGLTILVLNYNNIVDAKYINLRNQNDLTTLEMKNNSIHKLNETSLNLPISLTSLDLGANRITEIAPSSFHGVSRLNSLFLGHNELKQIEYGAFQGLIHLYNLDLSFNHIKFLDAKVLMDLKSLTILSLRSNKLHYLDYKVWYGHKYAIKVFLEGNSITCDWLASALSDYNNGYSRMRPSVLPYRPASSEHTLDGIPCISKIKEGAPENLKMVDMSARYELGDERLLIINQKILEAIQQQNNYLKTFTNQFNINVNSLILHKLKKRAHILV